MGPKLSRRTLTPGPTETASSTSVSGRQQYPRWQKALLLAAFLVLDVSRNLVSQEFLNEWTGMPTSIAAVGNGLAVVICVVLTLALDGLRGLPAQLDATKLLWNLPPGVFFVASQALMLVGYSQGLQASVAQALGYLYMPIAAGLSVLAFRRTYGSFEVISLVMLTLSALCFAQLRSNDNSLPENLTPFWCLFAAIVLSAVGAVLSERFLKRNNDEYRVQKLYMSVGEFGSILVLMLVKMAITGEGTSDLLGGWNFRIVVVMLLHTSQAWLAGLVAKCCSTVAKCVLQCTSLIFIYILGDGLVHRASLGSPPLLLLMGILALSAMVYCVGRERTIENRDAIAAAESENTGSWRVLELQRVRASAPAALGSLRPVMRASHGRASAPAVPQQAAEELVSHSHDFSLMAHGFIHAESGLVHAEGALFQWRDEGVMSSAWLRTLKETDIALHEWLRSNTGRCSQLLIVLAFILSDATRTLVYSKAVRGAPIAPQSLVVVQCAMGIALGTLLSGLLKGQEALRDALNCRAAVRSMPASACFSLSQTLIVMAYGAGVKASTATVLGYIYMPLSALMSRWVFGRNYSALEWVALLLLTLSSLTFLLLKESAKGSTHARALLEILMVPPILAQAEPQSDSLVGLLCVTGSTCFAVVGSLLAEKILKDSKSLAFYTQKANLELGGSVTAVGMLVLLGVTAKVRGSPNEAFWLPRPVHEGPFQGEAMTGPLIFTGWSARTLLALLVSMWQGWLGGIVAKHLSSVTKAVASCVSLLIIYFVGDLIIDKVPGAGDWVVILTTLLVGLSVLLFNAAGHKAACSAAAAVKRAASGQAFQQNTPQCTLCNAEFGMGRRRHHCRGCGRTVCMDCSSTRTELTGFEGHVRVCDSCVPALQAERRHTEVSETLASLEGGSFVGSACPRARTGSSFARGAG